MIPYYAHKVEETEDGSDSNEEEKLTVDVQGVQRWRDSNGLLNRQKGPAIVSVGYQGWFQRGVASREEYRNAEGKLNRLTGPAVVIHNNDGYWESWYRNDRIHRVGGLPAMDRDYTNDKKRVNKLSWFWYGFRHNLNGFATKNTNIGGTRDGQLASRQEYFILDFNLDKESYNHAIDVIRALGLELRGISNDESGLMPMSERITWLNQRGLERGEKVFRVVRDLMYLIFDRPEIAREYDLRYGRQSDDDFVHHNIDTDSSSSEEDEEEEEEEEDDDA